MFDRTPAKWASILLAGSIATYSSQAFASAFQLHEQSAALLGEFYAGSAAVAEDASTNYYNPAGLVYLSPIELSLGAVNVSTQAKFKGTVDPAVGADETGKADGGTSRLVPNLHAAMRFSEKIAVGFSATVPFGLATDWGDDSLVRSQATKSELETINLGPSIAYKVNDWLSFGAGFDAQYADLTLNARSNVGLGEATVKNKADSWGWGYHLGAMVETPIGTRVGLNYRSEITHDFSGHSRSDGNSSRVSGTADFPWLIDLSGYHEFNERISALATISYVHWSSIEEIKLKGVLVPGGGGATATTTDPLNYSDTWTFLGGLRYQFTDGIMFKVGGGYDQTPTNNTDRTISIPDENRWIASAGIRWIPRAAQFATFDIGYAHLFPDTASINKVTTASTATGKVDGRANLFGLQVSLKSPPIVMPQMSLQPRTAKSAAPEAM